MQESRLLGFGVVDEESSEIRLTQFIPSHTHLAGNVPEARGLFRGLALNVELEVFHKAYIAHLRHWSTYTSIDVKTGTSTKHFLQQHKNRLHHDDLLTLWLYSSLLGVSEWTRHEFSRMTSHTFFLPDITHFNVMITLRRQLNPQCGPGMPDSFNVAGVLQIPLPNRLIRRFTRTARMRTWSPNETYTDFRDKVEAEIKELNTLANQLNFRYWRIMTVTMANGTMDQPKRKDPPTATGIVAMPWTNDEEIRDRFNHGRMLGELRAGQQHEAGKHFGWHSAHDDGLMLRAFMDEMRQEETMEEDLDREIADWWGDCRKGRATSAGGSAEIDETTEEGS